MTFKRHFSIFLGVVTALHGITASGSAMQGMDDAIAIQQEQIQRMHDFLGPVSNSKGSEPATTMTFENPAAKQFFVDGTKIPEGESNCVFLGLVNLFLSQLTLMLDHPMLGCCPFLGTRMRHESSFSGIMHT